MFYIIINNLIIISYEILQQYCTADCMQYKMSLLQDQAASQEERVM
jgi:hypothetical protein